MPDALTVGLLVSAAVIAVVVVVLLNVRAPVRRDPPEATSAALLALARGDRVKARKILRQVVDAPGAPVEAVLVLGHLLREHGEVERATQLHQSVLARPSLEPEQRRLVELELADDLLELGRVDQAEQRLATLEEHFRDGEILERRATAQWRLGDRAGAVQTWERRVGLDRDDPRVRERAADAIGEIARDECRDGRFDAAGRWAGKGIDIDPSRPVAHVVAGDVAIAQGDPDEAQKRWQGGLRAAPEGAALILGRLLELTLQKGRVESLVDTLAALREERPDDVGLWRATADLRLRRGDREEFFALLEDPPRKGVASVETWAGWIRHLHARGDEPSLRRLLASMPDAFGPRAWRCTTCGAEEPEPRAACSSCGRVRALEAQLITTSNPPALGRLS